MSHSQVTALTHHAMLVAWGQFAQCIDLTTKIEAVPLHQKAVDHTPNHKVLEFFVAVLGGLAYLKDISQSAQALRHPSKTFLVESNNLNEAAIALLKEQGGEPLPFAYPGR